MKLIKKIFKSLLETKTGKPRLFKKILFMNTSEYYVHKLVTNNVKPTDVILDVGARTFRYSKYQNVKALFGVDLPSETDGYLGWTDKTLEQIGNKKKIYSVFGNCEELPFADNSFEKIIMMEVIEHIENDEAAISELSRVLKKNGKLIMTTPNGDIVENKNPHHYRHYQPDELRNILKEFFDNVIIESHFPNPTLSIKQFLPHNKFFLKKAFFRYLYWTYYLISGKRIKNQGTKIFASCKKPKLKNEIIDKSFDYCNIIACPKCKGKLFQGKLDGKEILNCNNCGINYNYINKVPFLLQS